MNCKYKNHMHLDKDKTGAGDAFIGPFLYQLLYNNIKLEELINLDTKKIEGLLKFSNAAATLTVSKKGAMAALPTRAEVEALSHL